MCDIILITGNVSHERECLEFPVKRVLEVDLSFCVQNKLKSKKCGSWLFLYSQAWQHTLQKPSYVVFVNYSTAYPSVHRDRLSSILLHNGIVGHMWHHLRARIDNIRLRVLHPNIQEHQTVDILRGLPEGSRNTFLNAYIIVHSHSATHEHTHTKMHTHMHTHIQAVWNWCETFERHKCVRHWGRYTHDQTDLWHDSFVEYVTRLIIWNTQVSTKLGSQVRVTFGSSHTRLIVTWLIYICAVT